MMEKILTLLVGLLIALGGWSLSRTIELSTGQVVLEKQVEQLEFEVRMLDEKMEDQTKNRTNMPTDISFPKADFCGG